jgi:hypothetical protein
LSKSSANRTLSALKAALNLEVRDRRVNAAIAREWAEVQPLKHAQRRRDLFWTSRSVGSCCNTLRGYSRFARGGDVYRLSCRGIDHCPPGRL